MSQGKIWLVKSSTRILGPFSFDDVGRLLKQRQISSIDEIRTPDQRWTFLRDRREFMELMKVMRQQPESVREDTQTSTSTSTLTINTKTTTEVTIPLMDDGLTPTPVPKVSPIPTLKDVTPKKDSPVKKSAPAFPTPSNVQSYGSTSDLKVQAKFKSFDLRIWLGVGALILSLVGFVVLRKSGRENKTYSFTDYVSMAVRAKGIGINQRALELLKKAEALGTVDSESEYQLAPLLIALDGQTVRGRRAIEKAILKNNRGRNEITEGNNFIGLSYLIEKDFKKADEYFTKVVGLEPNNVEAIFNQGMIFLEKGSPREAQMSISRAVKMGLKDEAAHLSLITADIEIGSKLGNRAGFEEGLIEARNLSKQSVDLRQKALFLNAYLENRLSTSAFQSVADATLDEIPEELDLGGAELQLYSNAAKWSYWSKYCEELYNRDGVVPKVKGLVALCYMKTGKESSALKMMEDALNQTPQDSVLLGFQSYLFVSMGKISEATSSLSLIQDSDLKLPHHVNALLCMHKGDSKCAKENWEAVVKLDGKNLAAMGGLAKLAIDKKKNSEAIEIVKRGLMISPNNKELLELRDQLEGSL